MPKPIKNRVSAVVLHPAANYFLISMIIGCLAAYVILVNTTVRTVTQLEKRKSEAESLAMKVSEMESKRLSMDSSISAKVASNYGFVEARNQNFIVSNSAKSGLSLKTD